MKQLKNFLPLCLFLLTPLLANAGSTSFFCTPSARNCKEYENAKRYTDEMNQKYKCEATLTEAVTKKEGEELVRTISAKNCSLLSLQTKMNCPSGTSAKNFLDHYKICVNEPMTAGPTNRKSGSQ